MTTYNGEQLTPIVSSDTQEKTIQEILDIKQEVKEAYEKLEILIKILPVGQPLVTKVFENGSLTESVTKTIIVDKPKGHYVTYRDLDIVMNAKTTKKDLKEVGL